MIIIPEFEGVYRIFSNFYPWSGKLVTPGGMEFMAELQTRLWGYPTTEHFFQAMKTKVLEERVQFKDINMTAGQAKRAGRRNITYRGDTEWNAIKDDVMLAGCRIKFAAGTEAADVLLLTGDSILIEGNRWHDNYWGTCHCNRDDCQAEGRNQLGITLMKIRGELRN